MRCCGLRKNRDFASAPATLAGRKPGHRRQITVSGEKQYQAGNADFCTFLRPGPRQNPPDSQAGERRERELQERVKRGKRSVALFADEAHDLNGHTLIRLKRLMEVVEDGGGRLSVILADHPKLRNNLRRPKMEEIGYRTEISPSTRSLAASESIFSGY